jgi:hypothetical protein
MNIQRPGSLWDRTMRGRPQLPAQLLDFTEEEYGEQLRQFGFSEGAVEHEVALFRDYISSLNAGKLVEPVKDGPTKGRLYKSWTRSVKDRRGREEGEGEKL